MLVRSFLACLQVLAWIVLLSAAARASDEPVFTAEQFEFFESKIRPVLVEHCFECHSTSSMTLKAGLKLDSRAALLKGGDSGPAIVPGKPEESLVVQAVRWQMFEMPPKEKLRDGVIADLVQWIAMGAPWPQTDADAPDSVTRSYDWAALKAQHWAWQPVVRPSVPPVRNTAWPRSAIDRFVLARLEAEGLTPAPVASPRALIRRVYFDLIGLPPTPDEVEAFLEAWELNTDSALEAVVDRLLSLPQYGERWARHWLDVARYSDVAGNFGGPGIPQAWRYRDWVVDVFNRDMPFDQFIKAQVAGDLLDRDLAVATGFFALGPTYVSDGGDPDATAQAQSETLDDRVDTLTRGLLGLTAACARCHDHKFDPIPQLDYYSLAGIFNNCRITDHPLVGPEVVKAFHDHQQAVQVQEQKIRELEEMAKKENRELSDAEKSERQTLQQEVERLKQTAPPMYPVAHGLADAGAADMALAIRGNLRKPGPVAPRRFLRIVAGAEPAPFSRGSGRLDLADALTSPANPLTARVFVNRLWLHHFGAGLVRTPSNFGVMGEPPTHPELLDWLSAEFVSPVESLTSGEATGSSGTWSIKRLHRLIVLSSTYRMSSRQEPAGLARDAGNRLLWRANPRRLDVEAWRDTLLAVTGELDRTVGGPPVGDLMTSARRTLYGAVNRNGDQSEHQDFLRLFDFPSARATSEGRTSNTVPQQFLFLMNSPFMAARAKALAARLQGAEAQDDGRIRLAYRLLFSRDPTVEELELGTAFLTQPVDPGQSTALSALEQFAQVLLSSNELIFVN